MPMRLTGWGGAAICVVAMMATPIAQRGAGDGEWRAHGGDLGSTKYAPLDQINRDNVSRLRIAWRRPGLDASITSKAPGLTFAGDFRSTPLMIRGVLYAANGIGTIRPSGLTMAFVPLPSDRAELNTYPLELLMARAMPVAAE